MNSTTLPPNITCRIATKYNPLVVSAFFHEHGLPYPMFEFRFHHERKWRWDICWPMQMVALEVQGGIFVQGRHSRGAAMLKEWEKLNTAAIGGWRVLYCQPKEVCLAITANMVREALKGSRRDSARAWGD